MPKHSKEERARRGKLLVWLICVVGLVLLVLLLLQLRVTLKRTDASRIDNDAAGQTSAFLEMVSEALGENVEAQPIRDLAEELRSAAEEEVVKAQAEQLLIGGLVDQFRAPEEEEGSETDGDASSSDDWVIEGEGEVEGGVETEVEESTS